MKTITFECETITPMFLAGADGTTPELRPPSIKGAMRFWWRAMNGHLSLAELKEKEGEIFGNGGTKATKSTFSIIADGNNMKAETRAFVPHKSFMKQEAFKEGEKFSVKLVFTNEKYFEEISNLFVLVSFLGGFGKRVRRGMGSFKVKNIEGVYNLSIELNPTIENISKLLSKISSFYSLNSSDKIVNTFTGRMEQYPYIRTVTISKKSDKKILLKISNATHDTETKVGKYAYEPNLGYAKNGRFASPIYVSVLEGNFAIITELATFPKRGIKELSFNVQEQFINKIL